MTLLDDVEHILLEREQEICLKHKEVERGYLLDGNKTDKYGHRVDFWMAPRKGLYSVSELQSCLDGLVSLLPTGEGIESVQRESFREIGDRIYFGRVQIVEEISGLEAMRLCIYDRDITLTEKHLRRITLKLFPDEKYIPLILNGNFQMQYGCSVTYLERNRQGCGMRRVA